MRSLLKSFMFVLGLSIIAVSCTKDGSGSYSKRIVGTWQLDAIMYYNNNTLVETQTITDMGIDIDIYTYIFRADGKMENKKYPSIVQPWSISGNKLSLALYEVTILNIDSKQMVLDLSNVYKDIGSIFNEASGSETTAKYDKVTEVFKRID